MGQNADEDEAMDLELLLIEQDAARRDSLIHVLRHAGYGIAAVSHAEVLPLLKSARILLVIIGPEDLRLVDDLPRRNGLLSVPVLAIVDLANITSLLGSLSAGVRGTISRDRSSNEIVSKVRAMLSPPDLHDSDPHLVFLDGEGQVETRSYREEDLVDALGSVCDEVGRLRERCEHELAQRRKVEQALMESEAFYQSLVETLPMAMFRKDWAGRITFANRLMCNALRRPIDEIIGKTDYDFFPRDLAEKYRADDRRVLETQSDFETTEEFQAPSGELRYTHVMKTPVYDANGTVVGIQGIFSDVTEKERAEIELEQTQARLQALLDAATRVSVIATDTHGLIEVFNSGAERMLGYTASEMIGKQTPAIIHVESEVQRRSEEMSREFGRQIQGFDVFVEYARQGQYDERDWTYVRKDGSTLAVSLVVTARRDRDGTPNGFLGIATDISARKRAEQEMRKAKEAAESASKAKSDFLANMSHEIRTPLNAIIGMTELVRDTDLDSSQREYLSMVQESGEALLAVINDILDFSKIEAGKLHLESVPFHLREVLGDTMKSLALRAHRKKLELSCHIAPDVPQMIEGDPHRLRQIVINLVGNAIKFTEAGEVNLDVALQLQPDDKLMLHFRVQDTGIGIPQEKLDSIFEAFEQADTSTTRRYGGTGLGLAIVSRLVELMYGNIWVESEVGRGSTFHFTAVYGRASAESQAANADIFPPILRGMKVLVVDDNDTNRRILTEMLANWGMSPVAVTDVSRGLQEMETMSRLGTPFPIVLADANIPGQDGFTLAKNVQRDRSLCGALIMMLTSGDRPVDKELCNQFGVSSFLIKPIKQSELLDAIVLAVGVTVAEPAPSGPSGESRKKSSVPRSVLLAEDSLINQRLAIGLLEKWGHRVTVANNGREAVEKSANQEFDLILMDVQMPEVDGLDATRQIRTREQLTGQHIPIIAMTAHAMKGDRERCLESGMDEYLMKPIRAELLFRQIEDLSNLKSGNGMDHSDSASVERSNGVGIDRELSFRGEKSNTRIDVQDKLVDWALAYRAVNHDQELLNQVLRAFLEEGPQLVETMKSASEAGEWKRFQRAAHTLKSALRTFGVIVADQVEELEMIAKSGGAGIDVIQVQAISAVIDPVFEEMSSYLKSQVSIVQNPTR